MCKINYWTDIAGEFKDGAIILGNGASIAVDKKFQYDSLLEEARKQNVIGENAEKIFKHLHTDDFEYVLQMLWHTNRINEALCVPEKKTEDAYKELRKALAETVRHVHIPYQDVKSRLLNIGTFLQSFRKVISLNYDLIVYWAMTATNAAVAGTWFKDCFQSGSFDYQWRNYEQPYGNAGDATLVFYPHGNLALAVTSNGEEKIAASNDFDLLESILSKWANGNYPPLFVSEGTTQQKKGAIRRSGYLNTVYNEVLSELDDNIVVFGWRMSDQDQHIIEAIAQSKPSSIAISTLTNDNGSPSKELEKKIRTSFNNGSSMDIKFFDAESDDCWIKCQPIATSDCAA